MDEMREEVGLAFGDWFGERTAARIAAARTSLQTWLEAPDDERRRTAEQAFQEVFQDYTQNHYASVGPAAPMIFLGKDFWSTDVPAAPLVQQLARGREAEQWILITDDIDEAVQLLKSYSSAGQPLDDLGAGQFDQDVAGNEDLAAADP